MVFKKAMNKLKKFEKLKTSHVICFCLGAILPIYYDLLFLNYFTAPIVTSMMACLTASTAIVAAFKALNWFSTKTNDKAVEIAADICSCYNKVFLNNAMLIGNLELLKDAIDNDNEMQVQRATNEINKISSIIVEASYEIPHHLVLLGYWKARLNDETTRLQYEVMTKFDKYMASTQTLAIDLMESNKQTRHENYNKNLKKIREYEALTVKFLTKLRGGFNDAFEFIK
ncbi:hypothetical protein SC206_19145 [Rouxiella sp. T17]|uniref:hypothetical protein n=1 Tax=Rouxiella sp. T17 TaxID=3085684 RepID=UPI002FC5B87E